MKTWHFGLYSGTGYTIKTVSIAMAIKELRKQGVRIEEVKCITDAMEKAL